MLDLLYSISQFLILGLLTFTCGYGIRDIHINLKDYFKNKRNTL
jgi:hypothetical protein